MERMERDLKAKNLELADMLRERDRARFDIDRQKSSTKKNSTEYAENSILQTSAPKMLHEQKL